MYLIFSERNIRLLEICPYPPNASMLGGVVESLVKQVKNMIYSSIRTNILPEDQLSLLIKEINTLINKRPIGFKENIINPLVDETVSFLTPEMLLKGYDVPSMLVIPHLYTEDCEEFIDKSYSVKCDTMFDYFYKLKGVRSRFKTIYYDEFLQNMRELSLNRPGKYYNRNHRKLLIGDLVVIKQKFTKPYLCPVAIVDDVEVNSIGEVTSVSLRKGNGEIVRRHVSDIVFLESCKNSEQGSISCEDVASVAKIKRPIRIAAKLCNEKNRELFGK